MLYEKKTVPDQYGGVFPAFFKSAKNVEKSRIFIKIWYFFESNIANYHTTFLKGKRTSNPFKKNLRFFHIVFKAIFIVFSNFPLFLDLATAQQCVLVFSVIFIFLRFGNRSTMCFGIFLSFSPIFRDSWRNLKGKHTDEFIVNNKIQISWKKWKKVNHTSNLPENDWNITDFCQ